MIREKTSTDNFWDERALTMQNPNQVNLSELTQRELEYDFIFRHLNPADEVLEVGCGNGILTSIVRRHVKWIDSFDFSANMIKSAIELHGEINNKFYQDDLINPIETLKKYDVIICVRVLINLSSFAEQVLVLDNFKKWLKPNGRVILLEGFSEGFVEINTLRQLSGLNPLTPASISCYPKLEYFQPELESRFNIIETMHSGMFDYLTRVIYAALVGEDKVKSHSNFHEKILPIVRVYNPDCTRKFARLHGFLMTF